MISKNKTSLTLGMTAALALGIAIVVASPLSTTAVMGGSSSSPMMSTTPPSSYSLWQHGQIAAQSNNILKPGVYARGTIASLQNDKDGKPAWVVSGLWRATLINKSSSSAAMSSGASNTTTISKTNNLPTLTFDAVFNMVMLNGSAWHEHRISNFSLTSMSTPPHQESHVYNGTATITMKEGPVNSVPVTITTLNDNVQSIWVDPSKTMNHFGNTPIYGTITQDITVTK